MQNRVAAILKRKFKKISTTARNTNQIDFLGYKNKYSHTIKVDDCI